jgi:hypothetical protein
MSYTAKDLIDRLSKMPPDTLLWWAYAGKDEVSDYFVEGCEISDDDFTKFINEFSGDWEYVVETLADCVDGEFLCDKCGLYDYKAQDLDKQGFICSKCGEEKEVVY